MFSHLMQKPFTVAALACAFTIGSSAHAQSKPEDVLNQYFAAVQSHSVDNILAVFTPDAILSTADKEIQGHDKIREFYLGGVLKCKNFTPVAGPYLLSGNDKIAVEIILRCDGMDRLVGDFFTMKDGKISVMRVYSGKGYKPN